MSAREALIVRQSISNRSSNGRGSGSWIRASPWNTPHVSAAPTADPAAARTRLSTSSCCTSRPRLAPSAARNAISRARARPTREQDARDVRARDREHQAREDREHDEEQRDLAQFAGLSQPADRTHLADDLELPIAVGLADAYGRSLERRSGRRQALVGSQSPDERSGSLPRLVQRGNERTIEWKVDLWRQPIPGDRSQARRQDAGDGVGLAVDRQRPAHDVRVGRQSRAPEPVAHDHDTRIAIGGRFNGGEPPAPRDRDADHVEEVGRHQKRHRAWPTGRPGASSRSARTDSPRFRRALRLSSSWRQPEYDTCDPLPVRMRTSSSGRSALGTLRSSWLASETTVRFAATPRPIESAVA